MDRGQAQNYEEACSILEGFFLDIQVGADLSEGGEVALLTLVNVARRTFLGGVRVIDCPDQASVSPLAEAGRLRDAVVHLGGQMVPSGTPSAPLVVIGAAPLSKRTGPVWQMTWDNWRGGVLAGQGRPKLAEGGNILLAPMMAAATAAAEVFQFLCKDNPRAGKVDAGVSLWAPGTDWRKPNSDEPLVAWLPSRLWLIGLGNLGQAYLWALAALGSPAESPISLTLQDDDSVQPSNESTSLLVDSDVFGLRKARMVAAWLDKRGFKTAIEERRFGPWTVRSDEADDPVVALCGVDNALARAALEGGGFSLVLEAGLGFRPQGFRNLSMHAFPGRRRAVDIWGGPESHAKSNAIAQPAYAAMRRDGLDECGLTILASRTVGAPFVGLIAAVLVIAELLRRLHGGGSIEALSAGVGSLTEIEAIAGEPTPWLFGAVPVGCPDRRGAPLPHL
jgi:hypothetical protein